MKKLHIEQRENELFLGNMSKERDFKSVYKTIRYGYRAFDNDNRIVEELSPVFVRRQEVVDILGEDFVNEHF